MLAPDNCSGPLNGFFGFHMFVRRYYKFDLDKYRPSEKDSYQLKYANQPSYNWIPAADNEELTRTEGGQDRQKIR